MRILLLSAYDATSHRQWRQGLTKYLTEHEWVVLTLPDRFFSWRIRGNALSWAIEQRSVLEQEFDLIAATSMVDLATLKGLVPNLAAIPSLLYFHENQFAYPESGNAFTSVEAQITSIYSAMSATHLLFNSVYNRNTFLQGAKALLKKMPDHAPLTVVDGLKDKSSVLPVPLDEECYRPPVGRGSGQLQLVWNHRWEYDKGPDRLYLVLKRLCQRGLDFSIHMLGQQFRNRPEVFDLIQAEFGARIRTWGYIEDRDLYLKTLQQSDIVFSTALHDFQGIAMLEAMACGCIPVAPKRLAYPEYIPKSLLAASFEEEAEQDAAAIAQRIIDLASEIQYGRGVSVPELSLCSWSALADRYRTILKEVTSRP